MDIEAGGVADLQTDVMRFMAILSLCLMAIFALVQSIPLVESQISAETPPSVFEPEAVAAVVEPAKLMEEPPAPQPETVSSVEPPVRSLPIQKVTSAPSAPHVEEAAPEEGFTLRFATDRALTGLIAQNEIALYAITRDGALRMSISRDRPAFQDASLPEQYHEMDTATVPTSIVNALQNSGHSTGGSVKWGVTLTTTMTKGLNRYLNEYRGGALIIEADGDIRMDP